MKYVAPNQVEHRIGYHASRSGSRVSCYCGWFGPYHRKGAPVGTLVADAAEHIRRIYAVPG